MLLNLDEVQRGHDHFLAGNQRLVSSAEELAGRHALQYVQQHSEFHRRSGKLQDKTAYRVVKTSGGKILRISNPLPYAAAIDTGSKAHRITARNASVLRFVSRSGVLMFRRSVWHPGTRPYKFLYNATDSAYRVLGQDLERGMTELARRF
jgi:hypothetical protein